jgi:hypothetical protein
VGVKFAEQLLDQRRCQVEASKGLLFVKECFKVLELNLQLVLAGINETFLERCESTTQEQADLLDATEFPIKCAALYKSASQSLGKDIAARLRRRVGVAAPLDDSLEVGRLDAPSLKEVEEAEKAVEARALDLATGNFNVLD